MGPRQQLKEALANEQAALHLYSSKGLEGYPEVAKAFEQYFEESKVRITRLRQLLLTHCGG
ncbi:MAG TPA: hypothetical protein VHS59_05525 [Bacillota bacterium]|nr:hypothetical protein [Bacillota bacterium]